MWECHDYYLRVVKEHHSRYFYGWFPNMVHFNLQGVKRVSICYQMCLMFAQNWSVKISFLNINYSFYHNILIWNQVLGWGGNKLDISKSLMAKIRAKLTRVNGPWWQQTSGLVTIKEKRSDGSYLLCASKHSGDPEAPGGSKSSVGLLVIFLPRCVCWLKRLHSQIFSSNYQKFKSWTAVE